METQQDNLSIDKTSICIAMDISGSTKGRPLASEIRAVKAIVSAFSPKTPKSINLLPWSRESYTPILLPESEATLSEISIRGGTAPSSLYKHPRCLSLLRECGLWFLFTDGLIDSNEMRRFTTSTTKYGLHGKACIVVIFGEKNAYPPHQAEVSVGLANYGLALNALILFISISDNSALILQAKGCFFALLPNRENPVFTPSLKWSDLAGFSFEDLLTIPIPEPQELDVEQIMLKPGVTISMEDLYNDRLAANTRDMVTEQETLHSLSISESAKGRSAKFQGWLQKQQTQILEPAASRPDIDGSAAAAMTCLFMEKYSWGRLDLELESLRAELRIAHEANEKLLEEYLEKTQNIESKNVRFSEAVEYIRSMEAASKSYRAGESIQSFSAGTSFSFGGTGGSTGSMVNDMVNDASEEEQEEEGDEDEDTQAWSYVKVGSGMPGPRGIKRARNTDPPTRKRKIAKLETKTQLLEKKKTEGKEIWLRGFKASLAAMEDVTSTTGPELRGTCDICHKKDILCLLIRDHSTQSIAGLQSSDQFAIIPHLSETMTCSACAYHLIARFRPKDERGFLISDPFEDIISAIACVGLDIEGNEKAWMKAVTSIPVKELDSKNWAKVFLEELTVLEEIPVVPVYELVTLQWERVMTWIRGQLKSLCAKIEEGAEGASKDEKPASLRQSKEDIKMVSTETTQNVTMPSVRSVQDASVGMDTGSSEYVIL